MSMDIQTQVQAEMATRGINIPNFILNGQIQRGKNDNNSVWAVGYENVTKSGKHFATVICGDWKKDSKYVFHTDGDYTDVDMVDIRRHQVRQQQAAEEELIKARREARREAANIWNNGSTEGTHLYLQNKQIMGLCGAKIHHNLNGEKLLIMPIIDVDGRIHGLQKIDEDGKKRFIKGQSNKGHFIEVPCYISARNAPEVYVCEGFVTGCSIHMATGKPVICAMNAGNISAVCWALKQKNPAMKIIIAADNDRKNKDCNIGKEKSYAAAQEVNAKLVSPVFHSGNEELSDFNDVHVNSGLGEVANQLKNYEEVEPCNLPPVTLAAQFLETYKMYSNNQNRLVAWRSDFYQYTGTHFKKLNRSDFENDVLKFLQAHPIVWYKAKPSLARDVLANIEAKVNTKSDHSIPFWIPFPELPVDNFITLKNGVIDLDGVKNTSDIKLLPHCSDLLQITCLGFEFNPKAQCCEWLKFLNKMVPNKETQKSLQEWIGLNLVFDTTFQKFAIFFGEGANGKTVICAVMKALLGSQNVSAVNLEAFDPKRTFNIAMTSGKLANVVEELNVSSKAEEGELKKFVSGGLMTVERKGQDPFEMTPSARLTFATNVLPRFTDSSQGLWRRLLLFPFKVQILDPKDQDRKLVDVEFWKSSGELSGILNWALEGLLRLRQNKAFTISDDMREAARSFEKESNPTREFLMDVCEVVNGAELVTTDLYEKYKAYMHSCGSSPLGETKFANEVRLAFPTVEKSKDAKIIAGVRHRVWSNLSIKIGVGGVV